MAQQALPYGAVDNDPNPANRIPNRTAWQRTGEMFSDLYAIQSRVVNASDIRFASQPTLEERIQAAIDQAVVELATAVYVPANMLPYDASLVTFNIAVKMIREGGDSSVYDLRAYGAVGDGVNDDTPAVFAAFKGSATGPSENASGGIIFAPRGTYLLTSNFFASIPSFRATRIVGAGMFSTVFKKGFNGSWFTYGINVGNYIRWEHLTFDGQHDAGRTGAGFVYTGQVGGAGNDFHSYFRCQFLAIESHFSIGSNAAQYLSLLDCEAYPSAAQQSAGEFSFFASSADDTPGAARHRRITHCNLPLGVINIAGMQDVYLATTNTKRLETSATTAEYYVTASLLGNPTSATPLMGVGTVVGCRLAGDVVLDASFSGAFVGNFQSAGTFTDNTTGSNAVVIHHPLSSTYNYVGHHAILRTPSGDEVVQTSRNFGFSDADATLTAGSSAPCVRFESALAANRVITLSTTGAKNGDRFRIVRHGLGSFTMDVGPGLKTIPSATAAFVEVEFTGSAWSLIGYGVL